MINERFAYAILTLIIGLVLLQLLARYIGKVFHANMARETDMYQGGEKLHAHEWRYCTNQFCLTMFFMILHVLGFIAATLYVFTYFSLNPLNFTTITFGVLLFYTVLIIRNAEKVRVY